MELIFRGAAREVGRSCIEVKTNNKRYLLDCGVKFTEDGFAYPEGVFDIPKIDGVFLSHAHLDHSGGLPFFEHYKLNCPIFCTRQTKNITRILLKDSFEVARIRHLHPAFEKTDLKEVKKDIKIVKIGEEYEYQRLKFKYYNAGHIPGSASILIETEGKRIVYSGDINLKESYLMKKADTDYEGPIDTLIIESTYGNRELPEREKTAEELVKKIEEVVKRGGSVLIPVFAVGRAQEILQILSRKKFKVPIYYDGMAKKVTRNILTTPSKHVKNKEILADMFYNVVRSPRSQKERNEIAQKQGIFITTSGMVQGGPVMHYLKHLWHNPKNAVLLTGYQCKRTNGRNLLEHGYVYIKGWKTDVKCEVKKFDFSGHSDSKALKEYIKKIKPKKLIIQHGDPESVDALAEWAKKNCDCEVYGPRIGEKIKI